MKMKGFRGDALIAGGRRGVRQNSRKRKFSCRSNSLRSGPPFEENKRTYLKNTLTVVTCCCHTCCCHTCCFFFLSNMNLLGFARKAAHGALDSHRAYQRGEWEVSLRQRAVHEEPSSDSDRGSNLLPSSVQPRFSHSGKN